VSEWRIREYRGKLAAVRSEDGKTVRVSLRTSDRGEAERRLKDLQRTEIGSTVAEIVNAYLEDKDKTAIRNQGMRDAWKNSSPHFGHLRPDQITRQVCRAYTKSRRAIGRKDATIRKEIEVVRAGLNFNKLGADAVFELPRQPPAKDRYLSRQEARRLVKAARGYPHIRAFIALSLATAARSSALLELTWDRVDMERRLISLSLGDAEDRQRKNRATVPMTKRAYRYLRVLEAAATTKHVIEWGGHRVYSIKKGFASARDRAKLAGITPHILRHTAASWMAERRVPMFEISRYLGHSDTRITERRYAKIHPDYLRKASEALEW
jgi:integrase